MKWKTPRVVEVARKVYRDFTGRDGKPLEIYHWVWDRRRIRPKKHHFTVIVHHKHRDILPDWFLNNPAYTFENAFKKHKGLHRGGSALGVRLATTHAWVLINHKGKSQDQAVEEAGRVIRQSGWVDKKRKKKGIMVVTKIEDTIHKNLGQNRGRLTAEDIKFLRAYYADRSARRAGENP
jgi:hypothetical protein